MKRLMIAMALVAASGTTMSTPARAADVGVSINIGQPGFYGRLDIGDYPPPQVIYRQPVIIERSYDERPPVYMRVPPGHAKHWSKHCHKYNACGERVYFVQDGWYNREYVPRYQELHREHHEDREERGNDHHGDHENDRHGNGHDHGHGHDH